MHVGTLQENTYLLRLEKGEDLVNTLTAFCKTHAIKNAWISGLGSIENPTLAHYRVDSKQYSEKPLEGIFEVTNLTGNAALLEGEPLLHLHATLSDEQMHALAGHLVKGIVSATLEVKVEVYPSAFTKSFDEAIGLKLLDLPEKSTN